MSDLGALEVRLDYCFSDLSFLTQAVTHRSYHRNHNERLEFLGDSILGCVIAESLYHQFPRVPEGDLTRMRSRLVRRETLSEIARSLKLGEFLQLGEGERKSGGFDRSSILADALEAVIGAIYLDGGFRSVRTVILKLFSSRLAIITTGGMKDNKTKLQEILQKDDRPLPEYRLMSQTGKAHELEFEVQCSLTDTDNQFVAKGSSRRIAEQKAAELAIQHMEKSQ